ncbi:LysR family transcriptional regulator [Methylocella sp. CPCC 101449]|uniref:LysR family transcriptional regulator n=1 Tax=Methylocella sp. CPCC 101449 TaxID=2987531 RepID=UPI00288F1AE0|nr:LysR family transcriptional regulator [Methylocella sp. CPCC 101449]MDT2019530.1 LysR family transcriptional regulator [Methylocella sp. CPCC 101449]
MNDRQLRYAHAVWKERSFSRAAEKLHVSQPSLSDQVRQLEEEIGFTLFYRNARGVEPSINGLTFLEAAEAIVLGIASLGDLAGELRGKPGLRIRIGLNSGLAQSTIPRISHALSQGNTKIRFEIVTATSRRIQRLLHQQRLDVAFLFEGEVKGSAYKLAWRRVAQSDIIALVPKDHPFAMRQDGIDLRDLNNSPLIINEPRVGYGEALLAIFAANDLHPEIIADCDDIESLKYMVLSGTGFAIVPRIVAQHELEHGLMVAIPILPKQTVGIHFVRRPDAFPVRLERCLAQLAREFSAEELENGFS